MEAELCQWKEKVKSTRLKFYELNYYTTLQLLMLRKQFGTVKNLEKPDVTPDSLALLQSISSQVTSEMVCDVVKCSPQSIPEASLNVSASEDSVMTSQASPGLSMSDEIMASADIQTSARSSGAHVISDKPALTEDDLSEDEKAIMAYIITRINCPRLLILKAFEECRGKAVDRYDYQQWCVEHLEEYEFSEEGDSDDEVFDDEAPSSSESESESQSDDQEFTSPHGIVRIY